MSDNKTAIEFEMMEKVMAAAKAGRAAMFDTRDWQRFRAYASSLFAEGEMEAADREADAVRAEREAKAARMRQRVIDDPTADPAWHVLVRRGRRRAA